MILWSQRGRQPPGKIPAHRHQPDQFLALTQLRPDLPEDRRAVEWIAEGCNVFNAFVPFYTNVEKTPEYLAVTDAEPDSNQFYWANRLIGTLADAHFGACANLIERYQNKVGAGPTPC